MKTSKLLEQWLETLNEVSIVLEERITCEEDKKLILKLDKVIDDIYNMNKIMPIVENKGK